MANLVVGVVGLGNVGFEVAKEVSKINIPDAKYSIGKLVLFSRDEEKAKITASTVCGLRNPEIEVVSASAEKIPDYMLNIAVVCAKDPRSFEGTDRRKMGEENLLLNRKISEMLPGDCLEIIVTNSILTLPQDAASVLRRDPSLVIGCGQVDSIRARIAIEEFLLKKGIQIKPIDANDVFIIGDHCDGKMVFAYKTAKINNVPLNALLKGNDGEIEKFAEGFARRQMDARKTTNELTARSVVETLIAALTEKSYVSAGILCDFGSEFFMADEDYSKFKKPEHPVYLTMRTGFKDLHAGFFAGGDKNPDLGWFARQSEGTKRKFYEIAVQQAEYIEKVVPPLKRIDVCSPRVFKTEKDLELLVAINSEGEGIVYKIGTKSDKKEIVRRIKEPIKRIGMIEDELYATTRNSVFFKGGKIEFRGYDGMRGINSFLPWGGQFFATHSQLGLISAKDINFYQLYAEPSRELTVFRNIPVFASKNRLMRADSSDYAKQYKIVSREDIIALVPFEENLYTVDCNALYRLQGLMPTPSMIEIKEQGDFCSAAGFSQGIAILNSKGVSVFDPEKEKSEFYPMPDFRRVAAKNDSLVVYNESMINSLEGKTIMALSDKNSEIAWVLVA